MGEKIKNDISYWSLFEIKLKYRILFTVISLILSLVLLSAQMSLIYYTHGLIMFGLSSIISAIYNHFISKGLRRKYVAEEMVNNIMSNKKYDDELFMRSFQKNRFFMNFNVILRFYIICLIPILVSLVSVARMLEGLILVLYLLFVTRTTYHALKGVLDHLNLNKFLEEAIEELKRRD
ncbi:hypothetical protein ABEP12_01975 [Bacillus velezensis]